MHHQVTPINPSFSDTMSNYLSPVQFVSSLILCVLFLIGCTSLPESTGSSEAPNSQTSSEATLTIVATYSILSDLVANVAGDQAEVVTLVGPDGDAHTFEPTPADSVTLANATLIVENGLGFEGWLDDLYAASGSRAERIVATEGLPLIAIDEAHEHGSHGEEAHSDKEAHGEEETYDEHDHGEYDPHVWHDVTHVMAMVEVIRDALGAADPTNAQAYAANADAYLSELAALDAWVIEQIASIPEERRKLVTTHDTFRYFAARYGLELVGTALGTSTEASDPSAGEMAELIDLIRAEEVPALFTENVSNPELIERIAQETGVAIGEPLFTDALGTPGTPGNSYIEMVRHNVNAIVEALGQ